MVISENQELRKKYVKIGDFAQFAQLDTAHYLSAICVTAHRALKKCVCLGSDFLGVLEA